MHASIRVRAKHRTASGWSFLSVALLLALTTTGLMISVPGHAQASDLAGAPGGLELSREQGPADVEAASLRILPAQASTSLAAGQKSPDVIGCAMTVLPNDNSTSGNERAPMIRNRWGRSVYLITAAEMAASGFTSGSSPVAIGWNYYTAPGAAGSGPLIVYMQNSSDVTNTKSTTWTAAIAGMTIVHNATTTLPNVTGPFDITLTGGSPFTYTGGSLYVAFSFNYPSGALSTTAVVYCNYYGLASGLLGAQGASAPTTLTASNYRPETRLTPAVSIINNDASVDYLIGPGSIPFGAVGSQTIRAVVTNKGANALSNVPVTLNITGTETYSNTQTISSLAACGGQAIVTFASFTPSLLGADLMTVSVPADDVAGNNSLSRSLGVTLPLYSYKHPGSTASGGVGLASATGAFVAKFTTTVATSITAVNLEFAATSATTYRVAIYGDAGGGVPGTTPLYLDAADRTVTVAGPVTITLPSPLAVGPGSFFAGIQQTNTTNASLSYDTEAPIRAGAFFLASPNPPTAWYDFSPGNNFKLNIGVTLNRCYMIVASAGPGGSIAPSGNVVVGCDGSQLFTIAPDNGYQIQDVLVDGVSQGPIPSYQFTHVLSGHTIHADFATIPPNPLLGAVDWATLAGTGMVRFHLRWDNPSLSRTTSAISGAMHSQEFGVFLPDFGPIGSFDVPPIQPDSFFDVFFEVPLTQLPPNPPTAGGPSPGAPCPPQTHWDGNVDIVWNGPAGGGQVTKHYGDLIVCPGGGASLIHFRTLTCASPLGMSWSITGLCPGFSATLVNEDSTTAATNPVPAGWTGFISVTAAAGTAVPDTCCFQVTLLCDGVPGVIDLCAITCDCGPAPLNPVLGAVDWTTLSGTSTVRFHLRWDNPSATQPTSPISGDMNSQPFGVFLPDFGPIGQFDVPPIMPNSFFDVFFDIPLTQLPPNPPTAGGPLPGDPCPPKNHWDGNVDISWTGAGGVGHVNKHYGKLLVCPGGDASLIHVAELLCPSGTGLPWSITGLCPGFAATLVNQDSTTAAPNPVPPGWMGWIKVTAAAGTAIPDSCCFKVEFLCDGVPGVIDMCVYTCDCGPAPSNPGLGAVDWTTLSGTSTVRFHMRWDNPSLSQATSPISGEMRSQEFGVFLPDFGSIGHFNVPPIQPDSFFDVFFEVPLSELPPSPGHVGGPPDGAPCPPETHWDGNVDIVWNGPAGAGQVNRHFGELQACTGGGASLIHVAALVCPAAMPWSITGLCPGFGATLVAEDQITPAPNPVPPGWTGYIRVTAAAGTAAPDTCCFQVTFLCAGVPGVINLCAITCDCGSSGVGPAVGALEFGIRGVVPNPTGGPATVDFALSSAQRARLDIFDVAGHRVRTLVDDQFAAGVHTAIWDGRDAQGRPATPGIYFIRLTGGQQTTSQKFVLRR